MYVNSQEIHFCLQPKSNILRKWLEEEEEEDDELEE